VEDRVANRKLLVNLLTRVATSGTGIGAESGGGFEVREAINGQEAIEKWESWEPHLIWMDLRMPVMDGHEATKRIKGTSKGQDTVIVALTASAFEEDRALIQSSGCDDFIRKPFREEEIFDALSRHLGVRFVFEEESADLGVVRPEDAASAREILTPARMATLPASWISELHEAAVQLDAEVIHGLLNKIRDYHPPDSVNVADALAGLVHDFRFDTIMAITVPVPSTSTLSSTEPVED
jgi:CheY-like chemotaxis protein